ncbi:MAG: integrase arm-type DNA-binding domain-containing protein [Pseudomonadota bacterium]
MPAIDKLSDRQCQAAKPRDDNYKLTDGLGLYLLVKANGSKLWQLAYRWQGKQKTASFGPYPLISLARAREKRNEFKRSLKEGRLPAPRKYGGNGSFQSVSEFWLEQHTASDKQKQTIQTRLEKHVWPEIGHMPIAEIKPIDLLNALRKIEKKGFYDITKRMRQACGQIFRCGVGEDLCERDITQDIKDQLKPPPPPIHNPQLTAAELPAFLERLHEHPCDPRTRDAILLTLHTLVRTKEIREASREGEWELDGEIPLWRIPAERMKRSRPHLVPMSPQAIELQRKLSSHSGTWLLQGLKGRSMSENTMLYAIYDMGYKTKLTVHGLRGTGSTILNESGKFQPDWVERQLAHDDDDKVRAAYNAAQYIRQRYDMMCWWSDYLEKAGA